MRATDHTSAFNHFTHTSFLFPFYSVFPAVKGNFFCNIYFISEISKSYPNAFILAPCVFPQSSDNFFSCYFIRPSCMVFIHQLHQGLTWILNLMPIFTLVCESQRKARLRDELSGFNQVALIWTVFCSLSKDVVYAFPAACSWIWEALSCFATLRQAIGCKVSRHISSKQKTKAVVIIFPFLASTAWSHDLVVTGTLQRSESMCFLRNVILTIPPIAISSVLLLYFVYETSNQRAWKEPSSFQLFNCLSLLTRRICSSIWR